MDDLTNLALSGAIAAAMLLLLLLAIFLDDALLAMLGLMVLATFAVLWRVLTRPDRSVPF